MLLTLAGIQYGADWRAVQVDNNSIEVTRVISEMAVKRGGRPLTAVEMLDYVKSNHPTSPFDNDITRDICKAAAKKLGGP